MSRYLQGATQHMAWGVTGKVQHSHWLGALHVRCNTANGLGRYL